MSLLLPDLPCKATSYSERTTLLRSTATNPNSVDKLIEMSAHHTLCNHLLKFSYPATDLLPSGRRPYLQIPKDVAYREQPQVGAYHLTESNLDFFMLLPAELGDEAPEQLSEEDNRDITECISWLSEAPGVSELSAVSYIGDDDIWTRFSLSTTWFTTQGEIVELEKEFELSSTSWHILQTYVDPYSKKSWIALMNDLMVGGSDRAVLHSRLRLDAYDQRLADHDESTWIVDWDERPDISPNQLLANHLELVSYEAEDDDAAYAPVVSLQSYADNKNLRVRLPCNHESTTSAGILKNLSREDCLTAHCALPTCQRPIMDKEDDRLLDLAQQKEERAEWAIDQIDWERLDHEVRNGPRAAEIAGAELYRAVKLALASMKAPETATPPALDPTDFLATNIVKRHFRHILSSVPEINWSPRTVLIELQQEASKALKAASPFDDVQMLLLMLPPGFEEFLCQWLTRAVNYALPSSIDMSEDVAAGFTAVLENMGRVQLDQSPECEKGIDLDGNIEMEE